jgi:DNA-binding sugar fermentation-stimulating protein
LGYAPRIPVRVEEFADAARRESWRTEKGMLVFQLHSDIHRTTPVDVFVYEPFDFDAEYGQALLESVAPGVEARIIRLETLMEMKRVANRLKDLADLDALQKLDPYKK